MTHTIEVTEEDIKNGVRCEACTCPIALALSKHFNRPCIVAMLIWRFSSEKSVLLAYALPIEVRRFIREFDSRRPVKPFTFKVTLGEE